MILCKTADETGYYSVDNNFEWKIIGKAMDKYFTMDQFKQLSTALTKFGEYEEWKDTFEDIFHCYKYGTDEIQVKYTFDTYAGMYTKTRSISIELYPEEGWRTVTIIEAGPEKANMYGKVYSFDELMSLFPKNDYNEREWLNML